jgi:mannan endo-1,4-beta-mannosidase
MWKAWAGCALAILLLTGCGQPGFPDPPGLEQVGAHLGDTSHLIGVFERGAPYSYAPIDKFAGDIGRQPNVVLYYSAWLFPFQTAFAVQAYNHGAVPLIQLEPRNMNIASVTQGRWDSYLRSYAIAVRNYGHPVILSFTHEMNGNWYSWGYQHTSPSIWVSAWRHVVNLFRQEQARNVIWLWTISSARRGTGPLRDWWPGDDYVNWIGIDGYYVYPSSSFASVFAPTITAVRELTTKPILLSEVGIARSANQRIKIPDLFAGIRRDHLLGVVWFDVGHHGSPSYQDWRLEGNPAAVAAFRGCVDDDEGCTVPG